MNRETNQFGRLFPAKWILVTSGACALALPLTFIVAGILGEGDLAVMATGLCIGAVVGYAQWFLLRKHIAISGWWGPACAVGLGVPYIVAVPINKLGLLPDLPGGMIVSEAIIGIIGGLVCGLLQMPLLKPHFAKSGWWILASSIGWGICFVPFFLVDPLGRLLVTSSMGPISAAIVTGSLFFACAAAGLLLLGVVTGICLLWMPKRPVQKQPDGAEC